MPVDPMGADRVISALTSGAGLRTRPLIVTIFGDMARAPGVEIPGPVLTALTARMGVKPETTRVALHRLRKDGWIAARRAGRVSRYVLTASGRAGSEAVTARIYARHDTETGQGTGLRPERWHVAIAGPLDPPARLEREADMAARGYISLAPSVWLGRGAAPDPARERAPADLFLLDGTAPRLPDWLKRALMPEDLARAYLAFEVRLDAAATALAQGVRGQSPCDRAAIRLLLVHHWRRLVLRHPDLPDRFFPADWAGPRIRPRVHALLDRIGPTSLAALSDAAPA